LFGSQFLVPHILSSERTGISYFRTEIYNSIKKDRKEFGNENISLPVQSNIDTLLGLDPVKLSESFLKKNHPMIIDSFSIISGGNYEQEEGGLINYKPEGSKYSISISESSSSVRSLLFFGLYINHFAKPGDLLVIDEPEMNLHPKNQRRMARILAQLSNVGIKILLTTHSDYILREINTLIMINKRSAVTKRIMSDYGYDKTEVLSYQKIKAYTSNKKEDGKSSLNPISVSRDSGIEARTFDDTIIDMNNIQEELMLGE
jgi:hypothetical protein